MEQITIKYNLHKANQKYQSMIWVNMVVLIGLIIFKAYSRPDLSHRDWVIWFLGALVLFMILKEIHLWIWGRKVQRIIINGQSITHETEGRLSRTIHWKDVTSVDFYEMKKHGFNSLKVHGVGKTISFDNMKGDYDKVKAAVFRNVDESKHIWGRMTLMFKLVMLAIINIVAAWASIRQHEQFDLAFFLIFQGISNAIGFIVLVWAGRTMWRKSPQD